MKFKHVPLHKKWSFPLRISSVSVTKLVKKSLLENFIFCAVLSEDQISQTMTNFHEVFKFWVTSDEPLKKKSEDQLAYNWFILLMFSTFLAWLTLFGCVPAVLILNINFLTDCNWTRAHNDLVHKRTHNHLAKPAKWLSCFVSTYLYGVFDCMFLSCHVRVSEWIHTLWLPECQGTPWSKQARNLKFKWLPLDSKPQPLSS